MSVRFGDKFELDARARQLRRTGRNVRLQQIPMEILLLLVEHAGEIVSREQIAECVWGGGVYLDTDNGIRGAIRKLRQALDDDAEQPRFIQTVTGRGYRFIAPVAPDPAVMPANSPLKPKESLSGPPDDEEPARARQPEEVSAQLDVTRRRSSGYWVPLASICLAIVGSAFFLLGQKSQARSSRTRVMVAVLPFQNLTGDASEEYIGAGLTEETIARLGTLDPKRLGVIASASVQPYKTRPHSLEAIGRELGVQYVLAGSVRRTNDKLRITAQLLELPNPVPLWSREYDHDARDLLALEDDIAQDVTREIGGSLGAPRAAAVARAGASPQAGEAHDLYLQGRFYWNRRTPESFRRAADLFQEAVAKAPDYAPAYAGLADTYALMGSYGSIPSSELMPKARVAAQRAVALDDSLAEAHTSLALIAQNYDWDFPAAEREYRRALALNPNYATAHHWYGEMLGFLGRFDEALAEFDRARELDPLSLIIANDRAAVLLYARQYHRAAEEFRRVLTIDPNFSRASMIVYACVREGRYDEAISQAEARRTINNALWDWALLTYAYGRTGRTIQARAALVEFEKRTRRQPIDPAPAVVAYLGVGDKERALSALQKAVALRSPSVNGLKVDPLYDELRSDPRFTALVKRVHLTN